MHKVFFLTELKLKKRRGGAIIPGAIYRGGNYPGGNLLGGNLLGCNSPGGNFPGGNSPSTFFNTRKKLSLIFKGQQIFIFATAYRNRTLP